jgi:DNA polymerase-3 subunit delta
MPASPLLGAVVLVAGDDPQLVAQSLRRAVDEVVGDGDRSLMVEDYRGDEVDLAAVADACRTPPMLTDRRVVVVRDIGRFAADEVAPLVAYLDDPAPTTALILGGGGGAVAPKLLAAVKAHGRIVATAVAPREVNAWVRDRLQAGPVLLTPEAETLVIAHLGEDLGRLASLVEVLGAAHGDGGRLGPDDVAPYLGEAGGATPWALTDAIDAGQTDVALSVLHRMLEAGERHPLVVLATLHRHVQSLLRVDSPAIRTEAQAAEAMGIAKGRSTFPAKKALASARRYGSGRIGEAVELVASAELDLKGATQWPGELVLEVTVARLCRLARAGAGAPPRRAYGTGVRSR